MFAGVVLPLNEKEYLISGLDSVIDDLLDFVIAVFDILRLPIRIIVARGLLLLLLHCLLNVVVLQINLHSKCGLVCY